jgi:hypothetical protein
MIVGVFSGVSFGVNFGVGVNVASGVCGIFNVGVGVGVGKGVSFGPGGGVWGRINVGVGVGTGTCAGTQPGPPWRDGMKPNGQGVGPTGGRNTPQIALPLIHCGRWSPGHDEGGGGRHDHWPLRQFGWPLAHGIGGGGLPPQT